MTDTDRVNWIIEHPNFTYDYNFGGQHSLVSWLPASETGGCGGQCVAYGESMRECIDNMINKKFTFIG